MKFLISFCCIFLLAFLILYLVYIFYRKKSSPKKLKISETRENFSEFFCQQIYTQLDNFLKHIKEQLQGPVKALNIYPGYDQSLLIPFIVPPIYITDNVPIQTKVNSNNVVSLQNSKSTWENIYLSTGIDDDTPLIISFDSFSINDLNINNLQLSNFIFSGIQNVRYQLGNSADCFTFLGDNKIKLNIKIQIQTPIKVTFDTLSNIASSLLNINLLNFTDKVTLNGNYNYNGSIDFIINYDVNNDQITFSSISLNNIGTPVSVTMDQDVSLQGLAKYLPNSIKQNLENIIQDNVNKFVNDLLNTESFINLIIPNINIKISHFNQTICNKINNSLQSIFTAFQSQIILKDNKFVNSYNIQDLGTFSFQPIKINYRNRDFYIINNQSTFGGSVITDDVDGSTSSIIDQNFLPLGDSGYYIISATGTPVCSNLWVEIYKYNLAEMKYNIDPLNNNELINLTYDNFNCSPLILDNENKYFTADQSINVNLSVGQINILTSWMAECKVKSGYCGVKMCKNPFDKCFYAPPCLHDIHNAPCPNNQIEENIAILNGSANGSVKIDNIQLKIDYNVIVDILNNKIILKIKQITPTQDINVPIQLNATIQNILNPIPLLNQQGKDFVQGKLNSAISNFNFTDMINQMIKQQIDKKNQELSANPTTFTFNA